MQLVLPEDSFEPLDLIRNDPALLAVIRRVIPHGDYMGILREETSFPPPTSAGFDSWSYRAQFLAQELYALGFRCEPESNQPRFFAPPKDGIQMMFIVVTGEVQGKSVRLHEKGVHTRRLVRANYTWDPLRQTQMPLDLPPGEEGEEVLRVLNVMLVSRRTKQKMLHIYAVVPSGIIRKGEFFCCDILHIDTIDMNTYVAPQKPQEQPDSQPSTFTLPEKPQEEAEGQETADPEQDDQTGTEG